MDEDMLRRGLFGNQYQLQPPAVDMGAMLGIPAPAPPAVAEVAPPAPTDTTRDVREEWRSAMGNTTSPDMPVAAGGGGRQAKPSLLKTGLGVGGAAIGTAIGGPVGGIIGGGIGSFLGSLF